jgi:hypothetical protein
MLNAIPIVNLVVAVHLVIPNAALSMVYVAVVDSFVMLSVADQVKWTPPWRPFHSSMLTPNHSIISENTMLFAKFNLKKYFYFLK